MLYKTYKEHIDQSQVPGGVLHRPDLSHLRMPEGFSDILAFLTREILREQPKDVIAFAARLTEDMHKRKGRNIPKILGQYVSTGIL